MLTATITAIYAAVFGLIFIALSVRIIVARRRQSIAFGTQGDPDLERRVRVHANFAEYVPLALLLIFFAEDHGAPEALIHVLCLSLLFGRIAHAIGLSRPQTDNIGRIIGMTGTQSAILGAALAILIA